jgi:uncharacterized protein YegL
VAIVTFGPVTIESQFHTAGTFTPPLLQASGDTPMGAAIEQGIQLAEQRKREYAANGIPYNQPLVFMMTDGAPTDGWSNAAALVREKEASGKLAFFAIGVSGANMDILKQISVREPLKMSGLNFRKLFLWISATLKSRSASAPGTKLPLAPPSGWAEV